MQYQYLDQNVVNFGEFKPPSFGLGADSSNGMKIPRNALSINRTTKFDTLSNKYIISEQYYGDHYKIPLVIDKEDIISVNRQWQLEKLWYESGTISLNSYRSAQENTAAGGGGLNLRIPVPMQSQRLNRLVGGGGVIGLRVTGEVNIDGSLQHNNRSEVKDVFKGSDYNFKLNQTQRFNITGNVGDKISVLVDQDSERDFDIQNNMRLFYTGEEDEIFQSIQAGNISLALPGTQFITSGGANNGLFGFKVVNKLGPVDVTSVASIERGEKKSLILQNGAQAKTNKIADYGYLRGVYFFVDSLYRDQYRQNSDGLPIINSQNEITEFELWISDRNFYTNPDSKEAWAVWDPNVIALEDTLGGGDQNNIRRFFKRLNPIIDYVLNRDVGYVIMERPLRNEVLAIAYKTNSTEVGDFIPPEGRPFILKLLRTDNPRPTDFTWTLEWKNVYNLRERGINPNGFKMNIVLSKTPNRDPALADGTEYIEVFGLDRKGINGESGADGEVDLRSPFFDFTRGHLILPGRRPLDPINGKDPLTGQNTLLPEENRIPEIYDQLLVNANDYNAFSQLDFEFNFANQSQTHNLGFNIIQDSEEVLLDGRKLQRGIGYMIDYNFGQITVLDSAVNRQGSQLEVRYESSEIFRLDKKTLFGSHMNYNLGDVGYIGGTALFLNERIVDTRVNVGQEPKQNMTWGINSNLKFQSTRISSLLDNLPIIKADRPVQLTLEGEFAQTRPNPNTLNNGSTNDSKGVAYIDDFEGTKRITFLGVQRRSWTIASPPKYFNPVTMAVEVIVQENRAKMLWFNPFSKVSLLDIFPDKEINDRTTQREDVLTIEFIRDSRDNFPQNPWGGIMKWMGTGSFNQSESKFIELWVKGEQGKVTLDLGLITEDAVPNKLLDTEDGIISDIPNDFNGILDNGEDVGIWSTWNESHPPEQQWDDVWFAAEGNDSKVDDTHRYINGTSKNGSGGTVDGSAILPDTEDIDGDGILDPIDKYFQFRIDLGDDTVSGTYKVSGPNENGWKLYRIPLDDFQKVGKPDWTQVEFARIWFTDLDEGQKISIYNVDLVGNSWKELGIAENDSLAKIGKYSVSDTLLQVDAVNTEDNPAEYVSPPGVTGEFDQIAQIHAREQSLALRFFRLPEGQSGAARSVFFQERNLIHYRKLKMFVYGDPGLTIPGIEETKIELFIQFGFDDNNYYEVRKKVFPGWDERNNIDVDLWEIPKLKSTALSDSGTVNIRELENGEIWKVVGNPSLQKIRIMTIGIKNIDSFPATGFVWIDELRVSEVDRAPGKAYRANINLDLSGIGTISTSYSRREADFHTINEKFGSLQNTNSFALYLRNFSLGSIIPQLSMFNVPLTYSVVRSDATPKYLQGSDILFSPGDSSTTAEEIVSENISYSSGFSVKPLSNNWLLKNSIQALNLSISRQTTEARDFNTQFNRTSSTSGGINHSLNFGIHSIRPFWFLPRVWLLNDLNQFKFYYTPGPISTKISARETSNIKKLRRPGDTGKETEAVTFTATRSLNTSYSPIENLSLTFSHSTNHDLSQLDNKLDLFSAIFNDSTIISTQQNVGTKYSPKLLPWLSPNFGYSAAYKLDKNRQVKDAGNAASSTRELSSGMSLSLKSLLGLVYETPGSSGSPARRPPPRRKGAAQEDQGTPQETEEEKKQSVLGSIPVNPLWYVSQFTNRIAPITFNLSQNHALQNVGLDGKPSLGYQLGFDADPGVPIGETLGKNTGSESNQTLINLGTSLSIIRALNVTMRYSNSSTITDKGNNRSGKKTETMFIFGDTRIPLFDYGFNLSNLQEFPYLNIVADNISLSHNYTGSQELNWTETENNTLNERFQWGFTPVASFRILWKKGINSTFTMNRSNTLTIDKTGAEKKSLNNDISVVTSLQWNTGFKISLPFTSIRTREIKNTVSINVDFKRSNSTTFERRTNDVDFNERDKNSNWSVSPTVQYSFTSKVTGNMHFKWQVNESKLRGKNTTKDFGLKVNIKIAG